MAGAGFDTEKNARVVPQFPHTESGLPLFLLSFHGNNNNVFSKCIYSASKERKQRDSEGLGKGDGVVK